MAGLTVASTSGGYESALELVRRGRVDVAVYEEGGVETRILCRSPEVAEVVTRKLLEEDLKLALQAFEEKMPMIRVLPPGRETVREMICGAI